jgi:stringent starvation protein B
MKMNSEIILNISPDAIRDFKVNPNLVEFKASFSGIAHLISVPIRAVLAIYAEENGQGMSFDVETEEDNASQWEETAIIQTEASPIVTNEDKRKSHLTLVE